MFAFTQGSSSNDPHDRPHCERLKDVEEDDCTHFVQKNAGCSRRFSMGALRTTKGPNVIHVNGFQMFRLLVARPCPHIVTNSEEDLSGVSREHKCICSCFAARENGFQDFQEEEEEDEEYQEEQGDDSSSREEEEEEKKERKRERST